MDEKKKKKDELSEEEAREVRGGFIPTPAGLGDPRKFRLRRSSRRIGPIDPVESRGPIDPPDPRFPDPDY